MGAYLTVGLMSELAVEKKAVADAPATLEAVKSSLQGIVNLDHYTYTDENDMHCWAMKPALFEGQQFTDFLTAQYCAYVGKLNEDMDVLIKNILTLKDGKKIIAMAKEKSAYNFQLMTGCRDYIGVSRSDNHKFKRICVYYDLIALFSDGKIIMECYGIFRYFEKMIRLQRKEYPIVDCVRCTITD
jgi:hypothetical protein